MSSAGAAASARLPIVLVPVGADEDALDATLAALEAHTPAGTRVWLADDAQAGPRGQALIARWLARTRLQAAHTRRAAAIGEAAHLAEALAACGEADVMVLAADARPTPGWLERLAAGLQAQPRAATLTPWCNAGEVAAWPRLGELVPLALAPEALARACAALQGEFPALPAAVAHAVLLRGGALRAAGGVDAASFRSWPAALVDLSLRLAGLGWHNLLAADVFVLRERESAVAPGDPARLAARWPGWQAQIAGALMADPLRPLRARLAAALDMAAGPQPDLFA